MLSYAGQRLVDLGVAEGMQYDEMRQVLRKHFVGLLERRERAFRESGPMDRIDAGLVASGHANAKAALAGKGSLDIMDENDNDLMRRLIETYDLPVSAGSPQYDLLRREFYKAYRDYSAEVLRRNEALESYEFVVPSVETQPAPSTPKSAGNTLGDVAESFLAENKIANNPALRTEQQKRSNLDLLIEVLGPETDIASIGYPEAQRVREVVQSYPKNRSKNRHTRDLSLAELERVLPALLEAGACERLSVLTMNTYLQAFSSLFEWARKRGHVDQNYFSGATIRQSRSSKPAPYKKFNVDQIQLMIHELHTDEKRLIRKKFQKWATFLGIYTGARLNEICQIELQDIKKVEGIWCIDLNDNGEYKSLKTEASRRVVPIHSQLLELGFQHYVREVHSAGHTRLFPELAYSPKHGWGREQSRWFNDRFLVQLGLKDKGVVFHSLRGTLSTMLLRANVEPSLVKWIVGHEHTDVTQKHYNEGYTVVQKMEAIERVKYQLPK